MTRTIRFMGRYSAQLAGMFAAFAAIIVAGCWLSGTTDGLFGTYVYVFFVFSIMSSVLTSSTLDTYMNIALAMGARRGQCFWTVELCSAANLLILVGLSGVVRWAISPLPCEEPWYAPNRKMWLLLIAAGLFFGQLGMLVWRIKDPRWRTAGFVGAMLLCAGMADVLMLCNMLERFALPDWLLNGMLAGFPVGTVAAGFAASRKYQKAVVRV